MKQISKTTLIFSAAIAFISLTAFGIFNWDGIQENSDWEFVYEIDDRFGNIITKEKLDRALTAKDVIPEDAVPFISSYDRVHVTRFAEHREDWEVETNAGGTFNQAQINLLQSLGYGAAFSITGNVMRIDESDGSINADTMIFHITTIPSYPAVYQDGKEVLINYLKENSQEEVSIATQGNIEPGKISFTVNTEGAIEKVWLKTTCGYDSIDKRMLEIVKDIPGSWEVAKNAKGEKVDQELTFFFGHMGC